MSRLKWWEIGEFAEQRGDYQAPASLDESGADVLQADASIGAMLQTPLGEPPSNFDVRAVYDSRPVNAYDFNYSASPSTTGSGANGWVATFQVPNGYRAVPRKWSIHYDTIAGGASANSTASIQQGGAALPNNANIIVGMGTDEPIETFFLCEENTSFGITGINSNILTLNPGQNYTANVNVWGNLIAVTDVALPFSIANENKNYHASEVY